MSQIEEGQMGIWLSELTWAEICERGQFRCRYCREEPLIEDIDTFAEEELCGSCAAAERRWAAD
jgi:hypothetical protein